VCSWEFHHLLVADLHFVLKAVMPVLFGSDTTSRVLVENPAATKISNGQWSDTSKPACVGLPIVQSQQDCTKRI
jgi:hypothetical protein